MLFTHVLHLYIKILLNYQIYLIKLNNIYSYLDSNKLIYYKHFMNKYSWHVVLKSKH